MIEFRIYKSGGSWIAKRTGSTWTSGFQRCEQDAIRSVAREARFMRDYRVVSVRENGVIESVETAQAVRTGRAFKMSLSFQ